MDISNGSSSGGVGRTKCAWAVDELTPERLTSLLRLRYINVLSDAATGLGAPDPIRDTLVNLQRCLQNGG